MPIVARKQLNSARKVIGKVRNVIMIGTPPRLMKTSPTGASGGAVMAPLDALAIPIREGIVRVTGKSAFERPEADTGSRSRAPTEAATSVVVVECAAILYNYDCCRGSHGGPGLRSDIRRAGRPRQAKSGDRSGRGNDAMDHRSLLIWRLTTTSPPPTKRRAVPCNSD